MNRGLIKVGIANAEMTYYTLPADPGRSRETMLFFCPFGHRNESNVCSILIVTLHDVSRSGNRYNGNAALDKSNNGLTIAILEAESAN